MSRTDLHHETLRRIVAAAKGDPDTAMDLMADWLWDSLHGPDGMAFFESVGAEFGGEFTAPGFKEILDQMLRLTSGGEWHPPSRIVRETIDRRENPTARTITEQAFINFLRPISMALQEEIQRYNSEGDE